MDTSVEFEFDTVSSVEKRPSLIRKIRLDTQPPLLRNTKDVLESSNKTRTPTPNAIKPRHSNRVSVFSKIKGFKTRIASSFDSDFFKEQYLNIISLVVILIFLLVLITRFASKKKRRKTTKKQDEEVYDDDMSTSISDIGISL